MLARGGNGKLLGMIHAEQAAVRFMDNVRRRWRSQLRIGFHLVATTRQKQTRGQARGCQDEKNGPRPKRAPSGGSPRDAHSMTSRPTAIFSCAAAVRQEPTRFR